MILSTFLGLKHGNDLKPYSLVIIQLFYQMSAVSQNNLLENTTVLNHDIESDVMVKKRDISLMSRL
jgi:hypothetical protein